MIFGVAGESKKKTVNFRVNFLINEIAVNVKKKIIISLLIIYMNEHFIYRKFTQVRNMFYLYKGIQSINRD